MNTCLDLIVSGFSVGPNLFREKKENRGQTMDRIMAKILKHAEGPFSNPNHSSQRTGSQISIVLGSKLRFLSTSFLPFRV